MKKTFFACATLAALLLMLSAPPGCYYDNIEELYGTGGPCDTAGLTYNNYIRPLMETQCFKCHQPGHPSGTYSGYPFETYAQVKALANSGKLVTRTNDALAPMPQTGLLPDCDREKIRAWVLRGAPEG